MRRKYASLFPLPWLLLLMLLTVPSVRAQETGDGVTVTAEGMAALGDDPAGAREEAIWDAKRNAVEQAAGVLVRAHTVGRDFVQESDLIQSSSRGFIRNWEVVPGSQHIETVTTSDTGRVLHIKIRATVALLQVIHHLADIADLYDDLERPRLRVRIEGEGKAAVLASSARDALTAALRSQGFDLVHSGPAEIELVGRLRLVSTVSMGKSGSPYGVGESVGACRAELEIQVISTASEAMLFAFRVQGEGQSFQGDDEAARDAVRNAAEALVTESRSQFVEPLLARWAGEREEGHTVVIRTTGLNSADRDRLRRLIRGMRGLIRLVDEQSQGKRWSLRFTTRLATRDVRRRLADLSYSRHLKLLNDRGPIILCAAR